MSTSQPPPIVERAAAPLRSAVYALMLEEFERGQFVPGQRLLENDLCQRYSVSRTTIREVLRGLEAEGLVEIIPQKGPVVRQMREADARSIYELRGALEGLAGRLFVARASDEQLAELKTITTALQAAAGADDINGYIAHKQKFYNLLLEAAANPELTMATRRVQARVTSLMRVSLTVPWRMKASAQEIAQFAEKAALRDELAASMALQEHVLQAAKAALLSLSGRSLESTVAPA